MSIYWSRSFPRSNSSFLLCSGNASQSSVLRLRLREEMFLVDAGLGTPKICMQDELTGLPIKRARFENKVGSKNVVAGESLIKKRIFERFFIDLVAAAGEPLLLPQRFRQNRAWIELKKIWRMKKKVKGFKIKKIKRRLFSSHRRFHYFSSIQIQKRSLKKRIAKAQFTIDSFIPKRRDIVIIAAANKNLRGKKDRKNY
ncbi:hypothetical protein PVAP13_1KG447100 [Panicum virgatum]|uniref:Ribosomal protein S1 n=1 Tax=Panicum virgatum TaxID=38727 RepID=A0A8T0XLY5_PANVG|nr:hypothetical protein PVAP13_1KG447100 [Panicum virgatum]